MFEKRSIRLAMRALAVEQHTQGLQLVESTETENNWSDPLHCIVDKMVMGVNVKPCRPLPNL